MIRTLRVVMPVLAVFLLTGMFYMSRGVPELSEIPFASSELAARTQDEQISQPNFLGVSTQGDAISMAATTLVPIANQASSAEMSYPISEIETPEGRLIKVTSKTGIFMKDIETISMEEDVTIKTSDGYNLSANSATSLLNQTWTYLDGPLEGDWPRGTLEAGSLEISRSGPDEPLIYHFKGGVRLTLQTQDPTQ